MQAVPSPLLVFGRLALVAALTLLPFPARASGTEAGRWIAERCATTNGAIRVRPQGRYVSGYFGTLVADALVRTHEDPGIALAWMQWYVRHAHGSGSGIDGVADDVDIVDGSERSRGRPDSTDAYGAVFLMLARDAYDDGDPALRTFVVRHFQDLVRIEDSSVATLQPNGLTWSRPDHHIFYAIDNAQVYRGLLDAADLFRRAFHNEGVANRYDRLAQRVAEGMKAILWDPQAQSYRPYMNDAGTSGAANLDVPYPDALAQIFEIHYGVVDPHSPLATSLVRRSAPAILAANEPLDEERLVLLVTESEMDRPIAVPSFSPPKLCIDAAWYLDLERKQEAARSVEEGVPQGGPT